MLKYYILLVITIITNVVAQTFIKKGALLLDFSTGNLKSIIMQLMKNYLIFTGLITYALSFVLMIIVLSKVSLNKVYPLNFALGFILILIVSHAFVGEKITFNIITGGIFILLGIFFIIK